MIRGKECIDTKGRKAEYVPQIRIAEITDEGEVKEEITITGRNAIIIFEAAKINERLEAKECYMEDGAILNVAEIMRG
ncbi:hypothetical protein AALB51_16875 [Lachnospiraceae bacterium 62-26]